MDINRQVRRAATLSVALGLCAAAATAPSASATTRSVPKCSTSDLSAKQTSTGAGMSQPSSTITLTNTSGTTCKLKGYPTITAASTKKGPQEISVGRGNLMNAPQTKQRRIVLAPGGKAFFSIGSATAFDPPIVEFTSITFATAPGGKTATVKVQLWSTAPTGKPFPIGVTAYGSGAGPTPN